MSQYSSRCHLPRSTRVAASTRRLQSTTHTWRTAHRSSSVRCMHAREAATARYEGPTAADAARSGATWRREVLQAAVTTLVAAGWPSQPALAEPVEALESSDEVTGMPALEEAPVPAQEEVIDGHRVTQKVYFDVAVNGAPLGRVVVGLFGEEAPIGAGRFADLARGIQGVGYRRSLFDSIKLEEGYIQNAGIRRFTYTEGTPVDVTGGDDNRATLGEMEARGEVALGRGDVSLVVTRDTSEDPELKSKLVAMGGKLVSITEAGVPPPTATAWCICLGPCPTLQPTNHVVGRVVEGMDIVEDIAAQPTVQPKQSDPFFAVAKTIGDPRATVAEKAFGTPFAKVQVLRSGILS